MSIYIAKHEKLSKLLEKCSDDASVLIPNLQRPYVWAPDQVIRLVDSLLRGWPFSTLLLWKLGTVSQNETLIPSRPFWRLIDRTMDDAGEVFGTSDKPNAFTMVLDGQQRLQSLLIVFTQSAGLKLLDSEWRTSMTGVNTNKGPLAKKRWTLGKVYLDLNVLNEFILRGKYGNSLKQDADFTQMLIWGVNRTEQNSHFLTSNGNKYELPLPDVSLYPGRFLSVAKIWKLSIGLSSFERPSRLEKCEGLLKESGVSDTDVSDLLHGFEEFAVKISNAQDQIVNFLELEELNSSGYKDQHEYNDAIVNIFTRLNSGGRTLTREEITFAWIKISWDSKPISSFGSATEAISKLSEVVKNIDSALELKSDEIVKILSFAWSVFGEDRNGNLVRDRDLLDGSTVRSMADWLYESMESIQQAFESTMTSLVRQGLVFGDVYRSVNALTIVLAYVIGFELVHKKNTTSVTEKIASELNRKKFLDEKSQLWFVLSQWAGEWVKGTDETMARYAKGLADAWHKANLSGSFSVAQANWSQSFDESLDQLRPSAQKYIKDLEAEDRSKVRIYKLPIWLWNRLSDERSKYSGLHLIDNKKSKATIEVDHVISWKLWESNYPVESDVHSVGNHIGNCSLLEKTFNISKGSDTLDVWLSKIENFPSDSWKQAFSIPIEMSSPNFQMAGSGQALSRLIELRTNEIKDALIRYISESGKSF